VIGLCTDSNAQLPPALVDRYRVQVVPLTVTVDGEEFQEGVDLDADEFYARLEKGAPIVTTAAPAPGRFVAAYQSLAEGGATEVLSVHIGSRVSATLAAARVGARLSPVPVRLVDTGTASFAVACCVWEAAEAVARGADLEEAAQVAERVASRCGNVFVVRALDLARAGGRLVAGAQDAVHDAIPVLTLVEGEIRPVGQARSIEEAADAMAAHVRAAGTGIRAGVGVADAGASALWQAVEERLLAAPEVVDLVRYRVGPSVAAHTGPGTAGVSYYASA
jgi:DegV family protein with EDD domain